MEFQSLVKELRSKPYYIKLLNVLVLNGLLDVYEEEIKDGKIDYLPFIVNVLKFLKNNKKYYKNFSSDTFEKILILSIDEILTTKFKLNLDEKEIKNILELINDTYLIKSIISSIRDAFIKLYYKLKCNKCNKCIDNKEVIEPTSVIIKKIERG